MNDIKHGGSRSGSGRKSRYGFDQSTLKATKIPVPVRDALWEVCKVYQGDELVQKLLSLVDDN